MLNKRTIPLFVFLLTLGFYTHTLLPSLAWGDGVKLQSEVVSGESFLLSEISSDIYTPDSFPFARVGVAAWDHPLYIILSHLLVKVFPSVDPLWLANIFSAIFGALSLAVLFVIANRLTESVWASFYASFSLAVAHTFWWHSSTPEVYTLFIFLLLVSYYFFDQFEKWNKISYVFISTVFLGLSASTHILAFLVFPAIVFYLLSVGQAFSLTSWYFDNGRLKTRPTLFFKKYGQFNLKILIFAVIGFLAGFSIYLIQLIRMAVNLQQGGIFDLVIGSAFLNRLGSLTPALLITSILTYLFFLIVQFGPIGLILGVMGIRKFQYVSILKIAIFFIVYALFGIFYRVTDQFTFFIASHVFFALLMGLGALKAFNTIPSKWRFLLPGILAIQILVTPFFYNYIPQLADKYGVDDASLGIPNVGIGVRNGLAYYINPFKRGDYSAYDFGEQTLSKLEPNAIVIAEWYTDTDEYFILRYFTKIKGQRSDVDVIGWPTEDPSSFDSQIVVDLVSKNIDTRPIYLASLSDGFYSASELIDQFCIVPESNLYRVYKSEHNNGKCLSVNSVTE